jgi:hypothetical protein
MENQEGVDLTSTVKIPGAEPPKKVEVKPEVKPEPKVAAVVETPVPKIQ